MVAAGTQTLIQHDKCVLIVEDDNITRVAWSQALEAAGYSVAQASDGREAINYLHRSGRPDLILLDLRMPIMNGWQFRHLQKCDSDLVSIPVVVCSGTGDIQEEAKLIGARHYLQETSRTRSIA